MCLERYFPLLPVQWEETKESASEHYMPKIRQKILAPYGIEIYINKSHFLYIAPSVLECHWNRSLLCQWNKMLCIMEMRGAHAVFLQSPRWIYDLWKKSCTGGTIILGKIIIWGRKKNYETVQPFKNLIPEILLTSGVLMRHINVCKIIDLNSIIPHTVIRLLHGLG